MKQETKSQFVTATEAREILGIAPATFARLVREGVLKFETNPLNKKVKLFDKQEIIALRDRYKR